MFLICERFSWVSPRLTRVFYISSQPYMVFAAKIQINGHIPKKCEIREMHVMLSRYALNVALAITCGISAIYTLPNNYPVHC